MIKLDLGHVMKTFVETLLPVGSPDLLAVGLRVDTWLNVDEDWLKPEAKAAFEKDPALFLKHCQVNHRYHEVLLFKSSLAYTQVYLQQPSKDSRIFTLEGTYAKVADHDSQWIDGLDEVNGNAFGNIQAIRDEAASFMAPEHLARLRPGQMVSFAQHPLKIDPKCWRIDDAGKLIISPLKK